MSNTESSAITRLINEAHGPVIEPFRSTPAPSPAAAAAAQRLARGTIAPHPGMAAPQTDLRPTQEQAWYEAGDADLDELIEEPDDEGASGSIAVAPRTQAWQERAGSNDDTPLPRVLVQRDDPSDSVGMARLPAPRATQAPEPQRRVSAQIVAPLPSPAPFGTPAPQPVRAQPVAAPAPTAQAWNPSASSSTLNVESMSYWEGAQKPRRTFLWLGLACALVGAGYVGYTMLRPKAPAPTQAAAEPAAPIAAPAPVPAAAPVAAAAVEAKADEVPAAPAPETLTAGFTLPGIPVDTRVVFDGKQLGIGPMKVQRLAPGPHKLQLIAASGTSQDLDIDLTPDAVTPLSVPAAPAAPDVEPVAAAAAPAAAEAAPAPTPVAEAPKAEKRGKSHDEAREETRKHEEKAAPKARAHAAKDADDSDSSADDPGDDEVKPKKAASAPAAKSKDMGTLLVNAKPPCEIIVDGKQTGLSTPQRDLALSPGAHTILLVNAENRIKKLSKVKITAGKPTRLVVDLTDQMN